jgi:phospholipid N-methyltransferase
VLRDTRLFLRQFVRRYHTTGSVLPSSRSLAKALCRYIASADDPAPSRPREILEVGPGTGAVTCELVARLGPADRLTLVEINDQFADHLRRRFASEPALVAVAARTQIIHGPLEALPGDAAYDRIISGLPLNNFAVDEVQRILGIFRRLLRPGGVLSFFEYIAIRRVKALVSGPQGRARLRGIAQAIGSALAGHEIRRDAVWLNVPPAWVHHVGFTPDTNPTR